MNTFQESIKVRIKRTLESLTDSYYQIAQPLAVTAYTSAEPLPFQERLHGEKKTIGIGESWGGLFDCAWFRFQTTVPDALAGKKTVLLIDLNGEGCAFDKEGHPLRGFTTGTTAYEYATSRKRVFPLSDSAKAGDEIDLWVDAGNNDLFGRYVGGGAVKEAYLAVQNDGLRDLYYDFSLLYEAMENIDENQPRAYRILYALNDAVNALDPDLHNTDEVRAILKPELDKRNGDVSLRVNAVGHAHIDLAWLWPIRETIRKGVRTFSTALSLLAQYPDYVFGASQAQLYDWMKTYYPGLYERIREQVRQKRWETQGASWVEFDTNITGGESLVRQLLYGSRFFQKEFGVKVRNLWLPDTFGYSGALPQIMQKSGIDYFMTIKLSWSRINRFPYHTFRWIGIDGSEVLCHMPPEGNYNSAADPKALRLTRDRFAEKGLSDEALLLYGIGDGGGGPAAHHQERLRRLKNFEGLPPVTQGFAQDFFDRIRKDKDRLPSWQGELYLEFHQGTYTTQARNKKNNRKMEFLLREAEYAGVLAMRYAQVPYPQRELETIWKEVLLYQFHDILPGSSIQRVYKESLERYAVLTAQTQKLIDTAYSQLLRPRAGIHTLINSLCWERKGFAKVAGEWMRYRAEPFSACVLEPETNVAASPAKGCLENEYVKVSINEQGHITAILLKATQTQVLRPDQEANVLQVYHDTNDAWDMDVEYYHKKAGAFILVGSQAYGDGPRQVLRQEYRYGNSSLTQEISVTLGSPLITFATELCWQEEQKMLRTSFPLSVRADNATCNIQFGSVKRPTATSTSWDAAKFEVCAQRWADISEAGYGAALLNDCKYGYRVQDNTLDLNLIRSTSYPGKAADLGTHTFRYALYPHAGDCRQAEVERYGLEFNVTPVIYENYAAGMEPFLRCSQPNITVDTIKKCEDSDAVLVRMYESAGKTTKADLALPAFARGAVLTDLMENELGPSLQGRTVPLTFKPFEIVTLKILS